MANAEDSITKAIDSIIQKTSASKCSETTLQLRPNVPNAEYACRLAVAVKIPGEKFFTGKAFKDLICNAWHLEHPWSNGSAGLHERNIFHIHFDHEADKKRVMDLRPWAINGAYIVIRDISPDVSILDTDFSHSCFWVRAFGLPPAFFTEENAVLIGNKIGRFLDSQFKAEGYIIWSRYLRIKVDVPIAQPLLAGFYLEKPNNSRVWIQLKYERLSDFCYRCGRIGHGPKKCRELKTTTMEGLDGKDYTLYGPWLRAVCDIPNCFSPINTSASNPSSLVNPSHKLNSKLIIPAPTPSRGQSLELRIIGFSVYKSPLSFLSLASSWSQIYFCSAPPSKQL